MASEKPDFVAVKLTAFGEELAGENGSVLVVSGIRQYEFRRGEVNREITRAFDWEVVLSDRNVDGQPLFELVEE
ncbi:MAG TPA: hypothetical protein VN577_19985 [Terriglobales bacterium]|nr:hypothetical protein [Clostridia bacterium]HWR17120.1 hypothetical protein [Terriglobales bacterium]